MRGSRIIAIVALLFCSGIAKAEDIDMQEYLFGHIDDSSEWHIPTVHGKHAGMPLPCTIIDIGEHALRSTNREH